MVVLPTNLPRHPSAAHRHGEMLPQSLLDHRSPRHQAKAHAVIEHRVTPAGEHERAPVDAGHALTVGDGPMLQSGFGGNVLGGLRQFPIAQRAQQVARENYALPASMDQPLFFEEVSSFLQLFPHLSTKAYVTESSTTADQLLVKPSGAD